LLPESQSLVSARLLMEAIAPRGQRVDLPECGCDKLRLLSFRLREAGLELADPVQQLAHQHGAGVVEPEVAA
jgi:hypothetical protein